jgi:acetoin utilization deacetylase AcuC-like enzyme
MTLLYSNPLFLQHETGQHPERAQRLVQITAHLARTGLDARCQRPTWEAVSPQRLARAHSLEYADSVQHFAERGGGRIEEDTVVCPASYQVALQAAGAVCDAVERVVRGEEQRALCLVRPPGHHALHDSAMGFCLFNNVAVGARLATGELGLDRVLIVDWDVHHGNGTQDAFWTDEQVGFMSIHRWPFYPGTGAKNETGTGAALGTTLNLPIEMGIARSEYIKCFADELERFADKIRPQLVILSAGFDSHRDDPIGSLGLETEDFQPLTQAVLSVAAAHAGGKLVSVLEGGYNCSALAGSVEVHLKELLAADAERDGQAAESEKE